MNAKDRKILAAMFQLLMRGLWCILTSEDYLRETLQVDYSRFKDKLAEWVAEEDG